MTSDVVLVAIIAAIPPTLAVMVTAIRLFPKVKQIHELVNSNMTAARQELKDARAEIASMKKEALDTIERRLFDVAAKLDERSKRRT